MKRRYESLAAALLAAAAVTASAITPAELREALAKQEAITVVDIRSTGEFSKAHIPGAINVPAAIVAEKKLPAVGKVIAYGTGLGNDPIAAAVAELNKKPGITAEALEGGFAGWESDKGATTAAPGLKPEEIHVITYEQLKQTSLDDVVLVDLRRSAGARPANLNSGQATSATLTDLGKEFPGARIATSPFKLPQARQSVGGSRPGTSLLVLIDNGDGSAYQTARTLRGSGNKRVVVLAGGEQILARGGKAGLQRQGSGVGALPVPPTQK